MSRRAALALGVILGALVTVTPASAQTALATIRGAVLDEQGGALPGVTLTIRHLVTNTVQIAVTGSEGKFFVPNLRPGSYEMSCELAS